jgi:DNA-directed RNA polymerase subunit M/transcription elongation factor TFIIS
LILCAISAAPRYINHCAKFETLLHNIHRAAFAAMPMRFCELCQNVLIDMITPTAIRYKCSTCGKIYDSTPEDTLLYDTKTTEVESTVKFEMLLRNAAWDDLNPREFRKCPLCPRKIMSYVVLGEAKKYIYVCRCGYIGPAPPD